MAHSHSCGGCAGGDHHHGHSHTPDDLESDTFGTLLYPYINKDAVTCLNEAVSNSGKQIIKPWDKRLIVDKEVKSDDEDDVSLIFTIPFVVLVKVRAICFGVYADGSAPSVLRLFSNKTGLDYSNINDTRPDQLLEIGDSFSHSSGAASASASSRVSILEIPIQTAKFQNVSTLTLHISANQGAPQTCLTFLGLKGDATVARRGIVETTYEASAQIKDHLKEKGLEDKVGGSRLM